MLRRRIAAGVVRLGGRPEGVRPGGRFGPGIVLAYAIAGFAIVLLSGLTAKVQRVPLTAEFGVFELLPPMYWLGLSLIGVAAVLALWKGSDGLAAVTGVVLLATLAGTPSLFEPLPRYWDSYMHFAEAQNLGAFARFPLDPSNYAANWPGAFLVLLSLSSAAGASALEFLGWFPFLAGGVTFLAIFELLHSTFGEGAARSASIPTALFAVWAQYHVSPQSIGFVLFLLVLATVRRPETTWRAVAAILFVGLVVSHPTSAILLLTILGSYAVVSLLERFRRSHARSDVPRDGRFARRIAVTFATVWLTWLFFLAVGSSEAAQVAILTRMHTILGIPEQTLNLAVRRTHENVLTWAPLIRTGGIGIYGLFGMVSLVALLRDPTSRDRFRFVLSGLIAPVIVALADIFAFSGQFYDRSILLLATIVPGMCFLGVHRGRIPKVVKTGVVVLLVGASVASASTAYYLEAFNLVTPESMAASDFLATLPDGSVVADGMYPHSVWLDPAERPSVSHLAFHQLYPTPLTWDPGLREYLVFDPAAELWYRQWYGSNIYRFYSDARTNYSLVYDNGWTEVYWVQGA